MKFTWQYLLVVVCILGCRTGSESKNENTELTGDYSIKIDSLISTTHPRSFNGIVLITQNGEVKYTKEYGYANMEDKVPISLEDNFRIQSNSKQITAVLTLKEVENGRIDLNSPISKYLPDLEQTWSDTVTVHQLLNMSSGIISLDKPLVFEPGTGYKYSNVAYGLLGKIIEAVSNKRFNEVANNLFASLDMNNTFCYEFDSKSSDLINGYIISDGTLKLDDFYARGITKEGWEAFVPAGGIISNATDLNTWDNKLYNNEILNPESFKLMTAYSIEGQHDAFGDKEIGYGYGLRIDDKNQIKHIGHAGKGIGFVSLKFYVPEKDLDVIVLENVYHEDPNIVYHFEKEIRKIVLNSLIN